MNQQALTVFNYRIFQKQNNNYANNVSVIHTPQGANMV